MVKRGTVLLMGVSIAMLSGAAVGCRPQLSPSEDAILYYFRSARVHGRVRRAWPEGQEYLNKVLKADAQLQKELDALRELAAVDSLWPREDSRWRDAKQLAGRIEQLVGVLDGGQPKREMLFQKLAEALEQVPTSLGLTDPQKEAFPERVWDALAMQDAEAGAGLPEALTRLEESVRLHLELLREVEAGTAHFDTAQTGLQLTDASCQQRVDERYDALRRLLYQRRETFLVYAEREIASCRERLGTIDKRAEQHEYLYLDDQEKFLRESLEALPRELVSRIEELQRQLTELRKAARAAASEQKPKLDAGIAFTERQIEQLSAEKEQLQVRIGPIVERPE